VSGRHVAKRGVRSSSTSSVGTIGSDDILLSAISLR
jgi:hypothetical protein